MRTIEYELPRDIDGEPAEVAEAALAQLEAVLKGVQTLAELTGVQVRNAWLTEQIEANPMAGDEDIGAIAELYPDSDTAAGVERVENLIAAAVGAIGRR